MQRFRVVYHGISNGSFVFSRYTHEPNLKAEIFFKRTLISECVGFLYLSSVLLMVVSINLIYVFRKRMIMIHSHTCNCWFCCDELYFPWMSRLRNCMLSYMWAINRACTLKSPSSQSCFFKLRCLEPGFKLSPCLNLETWRHLRRNTGNLSDWLDHCNPVCQLSVHLATLGNTPRHRVWGRGARLDLLWCFWQLNSAIECRMLWSSEILLSDGYMLLDPSVMFISSS